MSLMCSGVPFLVSDHCFFDVLHVSDQAHFPKIDLLQAGFDEAAARVDIVVRELLLDLRQAESVGDEFVGIDANLIFAGRSTEAGHIDDVGHRLEDFSRPPNPRAISTP